MILMTGCGLATSKAKIYSHAMAGQDACTFGIGAEASTPSKDGFIVGKNALELEIG